ncbi:MAG: ImmA/IrrE family metallo-endopeptidase [Candidatus Eremiobacteraeota bacterium]|nr:ImmA/IrrE family metallo-endopeptidase [Candidatus Eremiobacteraeota bacterium]
MRVHVKPALLRWARERVGLTTDDLVRRFPHLQRWEDEEEQPTLKQLERYASTTRTAIGYFFLSEPPVERVPIPDLRTIGDRNVEHPSPDLLDTIYICQARQEWYREFARSHGERPLPFVGSATLRSGIENTATAMREALQFDLSKRQAMSTWMEALRHFIDQADELGVLITVNGVVRNNNHRRLDPREFRGFALSDDIAPMVFINGADSKAAQMFTLAHELAHIWLGQSAVSASDHARGPAHAAEVWCNEVAAEMLVPQSALREQFKASEKLQDALNRLARQFKVSTLVILKRIKGIGAINSTQFWAAYDDELGRIQAKQRVGGGDFYITQGVRVGKRLGRALVASALEGNTLYRDAMRMLGISKVDTFREFGHSLGVG